MKKKNLFLALGLSSTMVCSMQTVVSVNAQETYKPGVTVEENSNDAYEADYQATFVYEDSDEKDAVSVTVTGNMQFYAKDDITNGFINTGSAAGAKVYSAYDYQDGMFNTGYGLNSDSVVYDLSETSDERFEITLPLPGNLYYYDYTVTYDDGTSVTIQDPANPSIDNEANGHDANHSIFYVGNSHNTMAGQEYVYERTDDQKGTYSFVSYEAVDGTTQPLGIYLPHNYDSSKTYKTIYVSHGGGGNENEWMTIGALPNIMDNLIAEKEVAQAIVVTMDNTYFNWDYDQIAKNLKENIIPYVEANYSVSKEASDRAFCGLSMGSMTTTTLMQSYTEMFGYYGAFSGANVNAEVKDIEALKNVTIYLTAGNVDMALKNTTDDESIKTVGMAAKLDELGVKYGMDVKYGAHDWGVWRDALTTFVKDYLWDATSDETVVTPTPDDTVDLPTTTVDKNQSTSTSVKTGDEQNIIIYGLGLLASISGLNYVYKKRKMN